MSKEDTEFGNTSYTPPARRTLDDQITLKGGAKIRDNNVKSGQVYTVDDAIEKLGFGPFQIIIFLLCGFLWVADAMELMILSILSLAVKCQWSLSSVEEASITSVVFLGSLFGSLFWGVFGDTFGRKKVLLASDLVVCLSGVLSAIKLTPNDDRLPGYPWLLLCRFGVGFGAAGITQVSTYFIEYLPKKARAVCTVCVSSWRGVGTMIGAALAVGVMGDERYGWHWYLGLSALPSAIIFIFIFFVPESARFYVGKGNYKEAGRVLRKVAWINFRSLPSGTLVSQEVKSKPQQKRDDEVLRNDSSSRNKRTATKSDKDCEDEKQPLLTDKNLNLSFQGAIKSRVSEVFRSYPLLFRNGLWKSTALLVILWFGTAWLYFGVVLLTTTIFQSNPHCDVVDRNGTHDFMNISTINSTCEGEGLNTKDYLQIMWTTGAEMPGLFVTLLIIEIIGRKLTMAFNLVMTCVGFCLLFLCTDDALLTFFLFIVRGFATGVFQTMYVYTPEVYPTQVRGISIGILYSISRFGAISTPYVAQVLFETSDYAAISVYAGSSLVLIVISLLLPLETKGKSLEK